MLSQLGDILRMGAFSINTDSALPLGERDTSAYAKPVRLTARTSIVIPSRLYASRRQPNYGDPNSTGISLESTRPNLYPAVPRDEDGLQAMTRAWTKVKTGE